MHDSRTHIFESSSSSDDEKQSIYSSMASSTSSTSSLRSYVTHRSFANLYKEAIETQDPRLKKKYSRVIVAYSSLCMVFLVLVIAMLVGLLFYSVGRFEEIRTTEPSNMLYSYIDIENVFKHVLSFEEIALKNANSRSVFSGYNQSLDYVKVTIEEQTNFKVELQTFEINQSTLLSEPVLRQVSPSDLPFQYNDDFLSISQSANSILQSYLFFAANDGCLTVDYDNIVDGDIAIIPSSGDCNIKDKVNIALAEGAGAVLVYNTINHQGPYQQEIMIASDRVVFGITYSMFLTFNSSSMPIELYVEVQTQNTVQSTSNLFAIANSDPNSSSYIMIGAALDSSPTSPGINDNASGSAALLEIILQLHASQLVMKNNIKFAWWSASYFDHLGSYQYLSSLQTDDLNDIILYIDVSSIGSPNYIRGILDGSSSPTTKDESTNITNIFKEFFTNNSLSYVLLPFSANAEYTNFINFGIPSGGVYAGTTEMKTAELRSTFGGFANTPCDTCYQLSCDSSRNINLPILSENTKATANTLQVLATTDIQSMG